MRIAIFFLMITLFHQSLHAGSAQSLNVIVILADDLGWTDLSCFGSDLYQTPHIDQLAREGMKFTQNYSACTVCSPTRAALLTGKYPARLHLTDWIPGLMPDNPKLLVPDWTKELATTELTLAELFRSKGYATASVGKWHLGGEGAVPEKHGFDLNIGGTDKAAPPSYIAPWNIPTLSEGKEGDYLTDRLADEAIRFVEQSRDQPFFLYMPHFAVHTPIQGKPELVAKYRAKSRAGLVHQNAVYAAMLASLDDCVGRIRSKLKQLEIDDRTLIIFTSDNGGRIPTTSNSPLKFGKASAYEGGVRVPLIVHWPGKIRPGSECNSPTITMDLFTTLVDICKLDSTGVNESENRSSSGESGCDGESLVPLLTEMGALQRSELFWHYPHHQHYQLGGATPYSAIRAGDFKLIEFFNDMHVELYNVAEDLSESVDLAAHLPEEARQLRNRLHAWRQSVTAQMPTPNPDYDPSRPEYTPPVKPAK
jgi:arylsulfatase A